MRIVLSILFLYSSLFGRETFLPLVAPKYVKGLHCAYARSFPDKPARKITLPKLHRGFWPHFCLKHLTEDPYGCSSWSEDDKGGVQLDHNLHRNSEAYYDPELIQDILPQSVLIPPSSRECSYSFCPVCKQHVLMGVIQDIRKLLILKNILGFGKIKKERLAYPRLEESFIIANPVVI